MYTLTLPVDSDPSALACAICGKKGPIQLVERPENTAGYTPEQLSEQFKGLCPYCVEREGLKPGEHAGDIAGLRTRYENAGHQPVR